MSKNTVAQLPTSRPQSIDGNCKLLNQYELDLGSLNLDTSNFLIKKLTNRLESRNKPRSMKRKFRNEDKLTQGVISHT